MRRDAKAAKPRANDELAVLRKSLKDEAARRRQLEKRLQEAGKTKRPPARSCA